MFYLMSIVIQAITIILRLHIEEPFEYSFLEQISFDVLTISITFCVW